MKIVNQATICSIVNVSHTEQGSVDQWLKHVVNKTTTFRCKVSVTTYNQTNIHDCICLREKWRSNRYNIDKTKKQI